MNLLHTFYDPQCTADDTAIATRTAVRAVLFDDHNRVPLLHVTKHDYHKLPGGGIEKDEEIAAALAREIKEETGCTAEIRSEVGSIVEFRSAVNFDWHEDLKQTSYCYWGVVTHKDGQPEFTAEELAEGFALVWLSLDEAIATLERDEPSNYKGKWIRERDLIFLKELATKNRLNGDGF